MVCALCRCRLLLYNAAVGMVCALSSGHVGAAARYRFMVPLQVACALWSGHAGAAARVLREGAAVVWAFWTGLLVPLQGAVAKGCWHFKTVGPAT